MEVDDIQSLSNKLPRRSGNSNGRIDPNRSGFGDEEAEDGEIRSQRNNTSGGGGGLKVGGGATLDFTAGVGGVGRLCGWPSSRIVRVSRASGGKDRHSKVLTSKGLRDRRVRLSVNTAIQFYDLQDRLGYDQPSKAVEWLLKAATNSISELPPISTPFPDTPNQLSDDKRSSCGGTIVEHAFDSAEVEMEEGGEHGIALQQQQQQGTLSKSACSSTSDTSKGSGGLSLSRSESRLKARERARERAAKEKEKDESEKTFVVQQQGQGHHQNVSSIPQNGTFTELLTSGFTGTNNVVNHHSNNSSPNGSGGGVHESNFFQKSARNWSSMAMDYFGGNAGTRSTHGFPGQIQLGNTMQQALATHASSPFFTVSGDTHQELQSFSLIPEHYVPVVTTTGGGNNNNSNEYNLNFSISSTNSSGLAGFNRGTLQSNSSTTCLLPQIQRFPSTENGSSPSAFFLGTAPPPHAAVDNHHLHQQQQQQQQQQHHFIPTGFDAGLQLFYGAGSRHADQKGKGKG